MFKYRLLILCFAFLSIQLLSSCARVQSGHNGVKWTITGGTQKKLLMEGIHFLPPWNKIYTYNIRTMDKREELTILAKNGLTLKLEASVRFRPIADKLYELQSSVGPRYYSVIIGPSVRASARRVAGRYSPEEIYSTKREIMEQELLAECRKSIEGKYIDLEAILIRNVELPPKLQQAISDKLEEEQLSLKMKYTLAKERQEAQRKKIEAKGIRDFQKIVSTGLTPMLLKWKGIETTEKLAKSPNSKIVIIGNKSTGGLPIILGPDILT